MMSSEFFQFNVGGFECMAVSDGSLTYAPPTFPPPAPLLFSNAPKTELEQALRKHNIEPEQWTAWESSYTCLLINTGEQRVLVDTGAGELAPSTGRLRQNLQAGGITPEEIDLVVFTHAHPDHINGNLLANGQLAFPNARYAIWQGEWDFWTSSEAAAKLDPHHAEAMLGFVRRNLPPLQDRLELIEREGEILPGIRAISAPGHTPGHMALLVSSAGEQLLHMADAVLHPIQLEQPDWYAVVDFAPDQVVATRRRLLNRAAAEKPLVLAFHFPYPGLGHIVQQGQNWTWQPIAG